MYKVEAYFRRDGRGGVQFLADHETDENRDRMCELRVRFEVLAIYPAEKDNGSEMDWDGDIATIHMRADDFPRAARLRDEDFVAAKAFLLREHGDALWQAGYEFAESLHFGEVA